LLTPMRANKNRGHKKSSCISAEAFRFIWP
jgi:hypothetical protein